MLAYAPGPVPCTRWCFDTGNNQHRHFVHMLSEIRGRIDQAGVRLSDLCLSLRRIHLQVCPFVESSKSGTFGGIGHHDEVIPGDVPSGRCLNGNFETRLDDLRVYRTRAIQAFPHCPGGREQFVNRGEVHGEVSSASCPGNRWLGSGDYARGMAA